MNLNKKPVKLAITIPAYNEEESIGSVIREILRKIEGIDEVEVIVINDGSKDRTSEVAKDAGADKIIRFSLTSFIVKLKSVGES